jgi:hypothetical protein
MTVLIDVRDAGQIVRAIAAFSHSSNGGLVLTLGGPTIVHRRRISEVATMHRLPASWCL